MFFPPHKDIICLFDTVAVERVRVKSLGKLVKRRKLAPMFFVYFLISVPLSSQERVVFVDDFPVEKCRQCWVLIGQSVYPEVTTEVPVFFVDVLSYVNNDNLALLLQYTSLNTLTEYWIIKLPAVQLPHRNSSP